MEAPVPISHAGLGLLLALTGCTPAVCGGGVAPPSTQDEGCLHLHDPWYAWARETRDLAAGVATEPDSAYAEALTEVERRELELEVGDGLEVEGEGFTAEAPDMIFLPADWNGKPAAEKAEFLWHALAHRRQWDRLGRDAYIRRTIVGAGRWSIEVAAYRENFRLQKGLGIPDELLRENMDARASTLYEDYELEGTMLKCAVLTSVQVWELDLTPSHPTPP